MIIPQNTIQYNTMNTIQYNGARKICLAPVPKRASQTSVRIKLTVQYVLKLKTRKEMKEIIDPKSADDILNSSLVQYWRNVDW